MGFWGFGVRSDIANTLGVSENTVDRNLKRFRVNRMEPLVDQRRKGNGGCARKLTADVIQWLMSHEMLTSMRHLNLRERSDFLRSQYGIDISSCALRSYYLRNNVRYKKSDLYSLSKIRRSGEILRKQIQFVAEVQQLMKTKYVIWFDETTLNCWASIKSRTWTDNSVVMPYQTKRGSNCTVYGGIGGFQHKSGAAVRFKAFFMVANKTNSMNTVEFLELVVRDAPVRPNQIAIVGDNHSAHLSNLV